MVKWLTEHPATIWLKAHMGIPEVQSIIWLKVLLRGSMVQVYIKNAQMYTCSVCLKISRPMQTFNCTCVQVVTHSLLAKDAIAPPLKLLSHNRQHEVRGVKQQGLTGKLPCAWFKVSRHPPSMSHLFCLDIGVYGWEDCSIHVCRHYIKGTVNSYMPLGMDALFGLSWNSQTAFLIVCYLPVSAWF